MRGTDRFVSVSGLCAHTVSHCAVGESLLSTLSRFTAFTLRCDGMRSSAAVNILEVAL